MTLNGHYALHCTKVATFGGCNENLNEDRPHITASKMYSNDSSLLQYNFYVYIRGGSLEMGRQATRVIENVDFQHFRMLNLQNVRK